MITKKFYVKIDVDNNSFSDAIDIGADAENVDVVVSDTVIDLQSYITSLQNQINNLDVNMAWIDL